MKKTIDLVLFQRLRRIVQGQVRSYMNDHPEHFATLDSQRRSDVIHGIAKRAVPDIMTVFPAGTLRWPENLEPRGVYDCAETDSEG